MVISERKEEKFLSMVPKSAYRWTLLDRVHNTDEELVAIYKHQDLKIWCVLKSSSYTDSVHTLLFSNSKVPEYVETDMECLINFISKMSRKHKTFVIKPKKNGGVSAAYKYTETVTNNY